MLSALVIFVIAWVCCKIDEKDLAKDKARMLRREEK